VTSLLVELTPAELLLASTVGCMRQVANLRDGRRDAHGAQRESGWQLHVEGACGELAVAKALGLFWSGSIGNLRAADVGEVQVRTRSRDDYDLIVHPSDPDGAAFVLVVGTAPRFKLVGWLPGREAKHQRHWLDPAGGRPAFFVKQSWLYPMGLLLARASGGASAAWRVEQSNQQQKGEQP
jgi:hypothetical protein